MDVTAAAIGAGRAQQFSPCNLQVNSFTAALVAQGDILFAHLHEFPLGLRFGLTGFTSPHSLPGRWRQVGERTSERAYWYADVREVQDRTLVPMAVIVDGTRGFAPGPQEVKR
jgi:hypothetical protein